MSYILDALERAQAQREQGAVPGLHTPTLDKRAPRPFGGMAMALGVAALVLVGLAAGWWLQADTPNAVPQPLPTAATPATATVLSAAPVAMAPPAATAPVSLPSRITPVTTVAPMPPESQTTPPSPASASRSTAPRTPVAQTPSRVTSSPPAPAVADTPPNLDALPPDLRAQIPALRITGAVQAQDPRNSLLLVNGQVLSPGAELAPNLVLERVDAHSAVLRYTDTRFRVAF